MRAFTGEKVERWPSVTPVLLVTLALQFCCVSWTFPLTELWTPKIQSHIDGAYHVYELIAAVNTAKTGSVIGFDPFFNAGAICGFLTSGSSARSSAVIAVLLHLFVDAAIVYKLTTFFAAIIGPLFIPLAARRLELSRYQTIFATAFGFILWWTSMFRWFHTAGMASFVMSSYGAVWYLADVMTCLNQQC